MNEEYNPYTRPQQPAYPTEPQQPQQRAFQPEPQPAYRPDPSAPQPQDRNVKPQPSVPPIQPVQPQYPQQVLSNNPRPVPKKSNAYATARVFGMVSFIIGCFVLPVTSMIYFNFRSSVSEKFSASVTWILFLSVPALVFGVISLMKKTDKRLFPVLGISFACVLMLCAFITYFVMVNTAPLR